MLPFTVRRVVPRQAGAAALALAAMVPATGPAAAQVRVGIRTGLVATSALVRDSIVETISLRPNPALTVGADIETQLTPSARVAVGLSLGRSDLVSRSPNGNIPVTTLTVWHPSVMLRQRATDWLSVEVHLGALLYDPSRRDGTIFRDGAPVEPVLGVGLEAVRPVSRRLLIGAGVGYDVHRFTTSTLQIRGFSGETTVHRVRVHMTLRHALSGS